MRAAAAALVTMLALCSTGHAQQPDPFGSRGSDSGLRAGDRGGSSERSSLSGEVDERLRSLDSVSYRLSPGSRLQVTTGKAGLFGFAGHTHTIQARAFHGSVVYYPKNSASSHLEISVATDSLEVLTPPDTAEIRKVTAAMRSDVLRTSDYHEITLVSRVVTPSKTGFHVVGALTMVGQTREVPVDVSVRIGLDTLEAACTFAVKQTDFGIKPYSGGPGGTVKVADRVTFDIRVVAVRLERQSQ